MLTTCREFPPLLGGQHGKNDHAEDGSNGDDNIVDNMPLSARVNPFSQR